MADVTVLAMEARLQDYVSGPIDKIVANVKGLETSTRSATSGAASGFNNLGNEVDKTTKKFFYNDRQIFSLVRSYLGLSAGLKLVSEMKKVIDDSVKSYEDWGRAVGEGPVKQMDALNQEHERLQIQVGQKLFPIFQGMDDLKFSWLSGVNILLDKLHVFQTPKQIAIGINNEVVSQIQSEIDALSTSSEYMYGKTAAAVKQMKDLQDQLKYANETAPEGTYKTKEERALNEMISDDQLKSRADASKELEAMQKADADRDKRAADAKKALNEMISDDQLKSRADASKELEAMQKADADRDKRLAEMIADDDIDTRKKAVEELKEVDKDYAKFKDDQAKDDEKRAKNELEAKEKLGASTTSLLRTMGSALSAYGQKNKELAILAKGIAMGEAVVNTAVAATKANSATPYPPVNALLMVEAIAQGAIEIAVIGAQSFARGTRSAPGGMALVGEAGAELVTGPRYGYLPQGSRVYNNQETRGMGNISVTPQIIVQGNLDASAARSVTDKLQEFSNTLISAHRQRLIRWDTIGISAGMS
jgi:hypothetical protein